MAEESTTPDPVGALIDDAYDGGVVGRRRFVG
jgi:hypothetical protein